MICTSVKEDLHIKTNVIELYQLEIMFLFMQRGLQMYSQKYGTNKSAHTCSKSTKAH